MLTKIVKKPSLKKKKIEKKSTINQKINFPNDKLLSNKGSTMSIDINHLSSNKSSRMSLDINPLSSNKGSRMSLDIKPFSDNNRSSSLQKKIDIFKKKIAVKKIRKLLTPFINRVSANILERIRYFNLLDKYLTDIDRTTLGISKKCLITIGANKYSIGDGRIILVKQIGTESKFGAVYKGKGVGKGELFDFAVKIFSDIPQNKLETILLNTVTELVISNKNPHFPLMYRKYLCDIRSDNESNLPSIISSNRLNYYIVLNELANGDLNNFITKSDYMNNKNINNALAQIYISILSLHRLGYCHHDTHAGNFLYHRINPGGYIKYNIYGINYYIENLGFLWVIWDYGKAYPLQKMNVNEQDFISRLLIRNKDNEVLNYYYNNYAKLTYLIDYLRTVYVLIHVEKYKNKLQPQTLNSLNNIYKAIEKRLDINIDINKKTEENFFKFLLMFNNAFINENDLPFGAKIINSNAYIIA
jgi:hypothetical protein